ncbi:hypothetical protein [Streptomyces sp. NPDC101237]|uniref:hypothetical protein n=1 Tax=Streptomyces sp. NPDC101237 TaxID=3366139 RepID=UPI003809D3A1
MISPAGPPPTGGQRDEPKKVRLPAVTAYPTGIAHTCAAAEKLAQAARSRGIGTRRTGRGRGWSS